MPAEPPVYIDDDEPIHYNWLARYLYEPGRRYPFSEGRLILTDRRLVFLGSKPVTLRFEDLASLRHERRAALLHVLVADRSGTRYDFWTKRKLCRAAEAHFALWQKAY